MLAKAKSCAVVGLDGFVVEVEVDISPGLPRFDVVGLPDTAVQEARARVRAAIRNSGCEFPMQRITANLAPADVRKAGSTYDLPLAVALLNSSGQIESAPDDAVFLGQLSLNGDALHTDGVLPMAALAKDSGFRRVFVPEADGGEAALVEGVEVIPVPNLSSLIAHLRGETSIAPVTLDGATIGNAPPPAFDISAVRGQEHAKRALEVAAAGGHNALMSGPPGSGKTLLARSLPSIMPPLTHGEAIEVTKIYSIAGALPKDDPLISERPFRSPHHTISYAGLVGGGSVPRPGEISLSHRGVLFLDELPEFGHRILEAMRQPLEDKRVVISRAQGTVTYPANFMLVGAMNPCPCGYYGDTARNCVCTAAQVARYGRRISGPLLDRIDIFVEVPRVEYDKLTSAPSGGESSAAARRRAQAARQAQTARFAGTGILSNSEMGPKEVYDFCAPDDAAAELLRTAMERMRLSARVYHRVLKLARTIADLAGEDAIAAQHVAEALQYRPPSALTNQALL